MISPKSNPILGGQSRTRRLCPVDLRRTQVGETPEKEPQVETLNKDAQLDKEPIVLNRRSSRMLSIAASSLALAAIGAVGLYGLPEFDIALPNLSSFAELLPRETASVPIPDPVISATLMEMQSAQQQTAAALQENGSVLQQNTAVLQHGATTLETLRQGFTSQQTNLKTISNQLSSLIARVDSLQSVVTPLTTSSIPQPNARDRFVRTAPKKSSRLPNKPVGPVSVGGAPLNTAPTQGSGAG